MFEDYFEKIQKKSDKRNERIDILSNSPLFNPNYIKNTVKIIDELDESDEYEFIDNNFVYIIKEFFSNNKDQVYTKLFLNKKFLKILAEVINRNFDRINIEMIALINRIIYLFITSGINKKYPDLKPLLFNISKNVNKQWFSDLIGYGLTDEESLILLSIRFSSEDNEFISISEMNRFIIDIGKKDINRITEECITNIYNLLYSNKLLLVEAIMNDYVEKFETEEERQMYSRISSSILIVIEESKMSDIRTILAAYASDYTLLHNGSKVRFSFMSLPINFPRINSVVSGLLHNEGIYIP